MREFNRERFMQLLHEVPESKPFFHEPRHNPYIQSLMDKLKEENKELQMKIVQLETEIKNNHKK